ncbi:MAG: Ig-like domain-containing protein, partial [Bacteriovoracaceae bacterium]
MSNLNGESGLVYSVTDPDSESANFAVRVIVSPVNDPPSFNSSLLSFMTNEDTPYNGSLLPFVFDIDSTSFTFELLSVPDQGGNISLNTSSGNFTYTPRQDFFGEELFKVRVLDDKGGFSEETTISLNVLGIDDIPVGVNTQVSIIEDTIKQIDLNFTDADGDLPLGGVAGCTISNTVNVTIVEDCTCSLSTCSVSVKPVANYYTSFSTENIPIAGKVASFDYIINTSKGSSPSSKVSIDISQVNDIPVPAPVTVIGPESLSAQALPFDFTLPLALDLDDHDNQNND